MRTSDKSTIDGLEFTTSMLPARRAARLGARLLRLSGPLLSKLDGVKMSDDVSVLASAMISLFQTVDDDELESLQAEILCGTSVKITLPGKKKPDNVDLLDGDMIDLVFTGRLATMYKAMKFAVEVNFADFFDMLRSVAAKKRVATPPTPDSSETQEGSSSGSQTD
jgi:hypothetical protein